MGILANLTERGFRVRLDGDRILVSPVAELTNADRELIRRHKAELIEALRPRRPSVESVETPEKGSIDTLGTAPSGRSHKFDPAEPRRCWIIVEPSGQVWESTFCPPIPLAEVQRQYPGAEIVPGRQLQSGQIVEAEQRGVR